MRMFLSRLRWLRKLRRVGKDVPCFRVVRHCLRSKLRFYLSGFRVAIRRVSVKNVNPAIASEKRKSNLFGGRIHQHRLRC